MTSLEMASGGAEPANAEDYFGLGMVFSAGAGVAIDLVQAHKWFNIAATRGHKDAAQMRREIAAQMSDFEIGCAQRAIGSRRIRKRRRWSPVPASRPDRRDQSGVTRGSASRRLAITPGQSPGFGWRNSRMRGYQGLWSPVSVHRQSGEKGSITHASRPIAPAR